MSCLRIILLFTLIYFALQDDELCYIKFNICRSHIPVSESNVITNCMKFKESICDLCEDGYASSYNGKSCISFPNCNELKEGDKECDDCYNGFYPINDGKECKIIPFENCKYISDDETKCDECLYFANMNADGECVLPKKWLEGCYGYNTDGSCNFCDEDYNLVNGECQFIGCSSGDEKVEYCGICKHGSFVDIKDGKCKTYGESDSSNRNKIGYALLLFVISLLL